MSFLNWILLGGSVAFAAPLIIHLLNRSRHKVVDWGAMHLLESALQTNTQRIQWQSWLLLLIRCMIPILLAFALARPVFTSWRTTGAAGNKSIVLLVDNSISMQALVPGDATRFDLAIEQVTSLISQLPTSTELSLWTIGGLPIDVLNGTTFDHRRVLNKLKSLRSGAGSVPVQAALAAGIAQTNSMQNANREVIVISDFQSHEWESFKESERAALKQQLAEASLQTQLTLLPISKSSASSNLSVAIDTLESPLVVANQVFHISAKVRNHGTQAVETIPLTLKVAGTEIATRRLSVPAKGVSQADFDCQIDSVGTHVVQVHIEDAAGVEGDNVFSQVVSVREPLRVLIVDKQADAPELQRASGYLSLALSPFKPDDFGKNLMQVRVAAPDRIGRGEVAEYDAVVLADALRLPDRFADELVEFVRVGGGLMMFSGDALDRNWYNARWGSKSKHALLPFEFESQTKPAEATARIDATLSNHVALSLLKRAGEMDLSSVEVRGWQRMKFSETPAPNEQPSESTAAQVLLRLDSGDPLLAAKAFGKGHVMLIATAADTSDSNLPLRPVYVPLMQSLTQWLAAGIDPSRNSLTGQPLSISQNPATPNRKQAVQSEVVVTRPDATEVSLIVKMDSQSLFDQTSFPGVYIVSGSNSMNKSPKAVEQFAVNVSLDESKLQFLSPEQLQSLASSLSAAVVDDSTDLLALQSARANGREIWRWALLGLVALLFVELWWQQRITRGPL